MSFLLDKAESILSSKKAQGLVDKAVSLVSPHQGLTRAAQRMKLEALDTFSHTADGYAVPGSRRKAMKGITATANAPSRDIVGKLDGMRALSRDLAMNAPLAAAILDRHTVHTIGKGLKLQSVIDSDYLGLSEEQTDNYQRQIEREFDLYAQNLHVDFDGVCDLGALASLAFYNFLLNGDYFFLYTWLDSPEKDFPYRLSIKLIDADLVRDPDMVTSAGKNIEGGVQVDKAGRVEGYYLHSDYPNEFNLTEKSTWEFIPVYSSDGYKQIEHVFAPKRIKQRRGVPWLAPVAEPLKQMTRLSEAELMSVLISNFFTVMVRDSSGMGSMIPDALPPEETVTGGGQYSPTDPNTYAKNYYDGNDVEMGYGNITYLDDNKDITVAEAKRSDREFADFWEALATQVCAGTGIPMEQAQLRYETSYTAARAAANDVWLQRGVMRQLISSRFYQPIYRRWFEEALLRQRIEAPGFFDDYGVAQAWTKAGWIGEGQGSLNPLDEAKADILEINANLSTREEKYIKKHGGRWDSAMRRRAGEDRLLEMLGIRNEPDPEELVGDDGQKDLGDTTESQND